MTLQDVGLVVTAIVAVVTTTWTGIRTLADRRAGVRATETTERRDTVADRDAYIDQLQEELGPYRAAMDARMTELEKRNGVLVDRNDMYRDLLHKHRAHIWDQLPPPPPDWPEDLPR